MKKSLVLFIVTIIFIFQGCSAKEDSPVNTDNSAGKDVTETPEATEAAKVTEAVKATASPVPKKELVLPTTVNNSGKVLIQTVSKNSVYKYNSYIITSINGESVVVDPTEMPKKEIVDINPAAIISTHSHPDHVNNSYNATYDVPKLLFKKGEIDTKDFHIYNISSSHYSDKIDDSNFMTVFEVDGLRIVHMGDIGQTTLTEEQLKDLGEIDIAFMQFDNSYSSMSVENMKGFNLIEQLNPTIIIPTHSNDDCDAKLKEKYGDITEYDNILEISKEDLPEDSLNVYRILNNHIYE